MKNVVLIFGLVFFFKFALAQDHVKRNNIVIESNFIISLPISYDRVVPLNNKLALTFGADYVLGVGFAYGSHWLAPEINLLSFGPKHFLESGIQYAYYINSDPESDDNHSPGLRLAYKYQSESGVIFRLAMTFFFNIDPIIFPTIGLGYAF